MIVFVAIGERYNKDSGAFAGAILASIVASILFEVMGLNDDE